MDEPVIQYATTSDGVNIACYSVGEGEPLLLMPSLPASHLQLEREIPGARQSIALASQFRKFVRFDPRGFGLSDRNVSDFSLETLALDIDAVTQKLGIDRCQIVAFGLSAALAIAYAATRPERVSQLAVVHAQPAAVDPWIDDLQAIIGLAEKNWELATETLTHAVLGWSSGEFAHQLAMIMRNSITPQTLIAFVDALRAWDVTDRLRHVQAQTLVVTRPDGPFGSDAAGPRIAAAIPDATLVRLRNGGVPMQDPEEFAVLWSFLTNGAGIARPTPEVAQNTAVILFADIVNSTALTEEMGDAGFRSRARDLDDAMRMIIRDSAGEPVEGKLLGDGVLAVFASARQAIDGAMRCRNAAEGSGLELRIGVHAGDVIHESNNVYGGAVNIAARVADACEPGTIFVSDVLRGLARTSSDVRFEDRGEHSLKGVGERMKLYAVAAPD